MGRPKLEIDQATRERILDAVIFHINRQGYNGAKTSEIATTANLDETKLFRLFAGKQALANEALRMAFTVLSFTDQVQDFSHPKFARKFLSEAIWHFANFYQRYPDRFYFVFIASHREFLDEESKMIRQRYRTESYLMIEKLIKAGYFVKADAEVLLAIVFGTLTRFVRVAFDEQMPLQKKSVEQMIDLMAKALLPAAE